MAPFGLRPVSITSGMEPAGTRLRLEGGSAARSKAEEFAPQRVFVKLLLVNHFPLLLVLVEPGCFPLVQFGDVMIAGGKRLLVADRVDPFVDRGPVGRLQFVQFLLKVR